MIVFSFGKFGTLRVRKIVVLVVSLNERKSRCLNVAYCNKDGHTIIKRQGVFYVEFLTDSWFFLAVVTDSLYRLRGILLVEDVDR